MWNSQTLKLFVPLKCHIWEVGIACKIDPINEICDDVRACVRCVASDTCRVRISLPRCLLGSRVPLRALLYAPRNTRKFPFWSRDESSCHHCVIMIDLSLCHVPEFSGTPCRLIHDAAAFCKIFFISIFHLPWVKDTSGTKLIFLPWPCAIRSA